MERGEPVRERGDHSPLRKKWKKRVEKKAAGRLLRRP